MSELAAYQRALVTIAFGEDDAPRLAGFEVYRELIRGRLLATAKQAFARSFTHAPELCTASFARYLAEAPPSSWLMRDVVVDFAPYAERDLDAAPPWLSSMLRFEAARWRVATALYPRIDDVGELDFAGALVLNPTLARVVLTHRVAELEIDQPPSDELDPHTLFVYRRGPTAHDGDHVRWSRAPLLAALLEAQGETLGERVSHVFARGSLRADEADLGRLASELTIAVERGIVLGTRSPVRA